MSDKEREGGEMPERIWLHPDETPLVYQFLQCSKCIEYVRADLVTRPPEWAENAAKEISEWLNNDGKGRLYDAAEADHHFTAIILKHARKEQG